MLRSLAAVTLGAWITTQSLMLGATGAQAAAGSDWNRYLFDPTNSGFNGETLITPSSARTLKVRAGWPVQLGGTISAQPVVSSGVVYAGAWDGYEYALCAVSCSTTVNGVVTVHPSGFVLWKQYIGRTNGGPTCNPPVAGVASTPTIATVPIVINGIPTPTRALFVGGGGNVAIGGAALPNGAATLVAFDALTGALLWQAPLGSAPSHFMWSSPILANGSLYVGIASFGDCPLVQGQVVQVDPATGLILHTFNVVPDGCTGGGVWSSPAVDPADGSVYVATGNAGTCASAQPYTVALLKLSPSLTLLSSWAIPAAEQTSDGDFGAAPSLFPGTVTPSGAPRSLVGIVNKNGTYYVFDRANLAAGPVARLAVAAAGDCPQCGKGGIAPSAWDGRGLYVAAGNTIIGGTVYKGSVRAFNPNNLPAPIWQAKMRSGPVLGAVAAVPGVAFVGSGHYIFAIRLSDGATLFRQAVSSLGLPQSAVFYGAPAVAQGVLYEGDTNGVLYALSPNGA